MKGGRVVRDVMWAGGVALVGCLFLWELLSLTWIPVARDMQMFFVPQRHLLWEALQEGRVPLWTRFYGTGAPLLANLQSGVFYPPHWLFGFLPFFAAFDLLVVFHFVLGGAAGYGFARRAGLTPFGGALAAATFMLGGHFASLLNLLNALQAAAWIPVVGYFLLRHLEEGSARSFVGLVATALLGFLAGEPQTFLIGCLAVGAYAVMRLPTRPPDAPALPTVGGTLTLAVLLVAGLSMVQLLPTIEMIAESSRAGGLSYEEATTFSADPLRLVHLLFPPDYADPVYRFGIKTQMGWGEPWLFSIYLGVIPLLLGFFAWTAERGRKEAAFWTAALVAGVLLSLGDHLPVYRWLFDHLPGFAVFRFPEKFFLLSGLGVAMLAGRGLDALLERRPGRRFRVAALVVLSGGLAAKVFWLTGREAFYRFALENLRGQNFLSAFDFAWLVWGENLDVLLGLLVGAVVTVWLYGRGWLRPSLVAALLLLAAVGDLFLAHRGLNPVVEAEFYERPPMIARYLPMEELRRDYRYRATPFDRLSGIVRIQPGVALEAQKWLWQQSMAPNTSQYHQVLAPDTWDAIKLRRYVDQHHIYRALPDATRRWRLLGLSSVRYQYHRAWLEGGNYRAAVLLDSMPGYLYEVADPVPRAYVVPRASYHATDVEALNRALAPGFDPRAEVALVGDPPAAAGSDVGAAPGSGGDETEPAGIEAWNGEARILEDAGETVRIALRVPTAGWLVLTDSHYPGWTATADGEEREIHLANYFFRAVEVRPGDREVVFRYRSRPYERGRWVSAGSLALLVLGLGGVGVRSRHRRQDRRETGAGPPRNARS